MVRKIRPQSSVVRSSNSVNTNQRLQIAGSDVANLKTTATITEDKKFLVVNGSKKWITNALWSNFVVAAVRTGSEASGAAGLSALIIPLDAPGVTCRRLHNSGVSASGSTFIEFDDVKVTFDNLLGGEAGLGKGFKMVMSSEWFHPAETRFGRHADLRCQI